MLLWLWPAASAPIQPLAQELPYAPPPKKGTWMRLKQAVQLSGEKEKWQEEEMTSAKVLR